MRVNRQSSLRERVQKTSQAFQFDALLGQGQALEAPDPQEMLDAAVAAEAEFEEAPTDTATPAGIEAAPVAEGGLFDLIDLDPSPCLPPDTPSSAPIPLSGRPSELVTSPSTATGGQQADRDILFDALDGLGLQLLAEAGRMRSALACGEVAEAGFCLAHLNKVIELLQSMDPEGDVARRLGTAAAPPVGRRWPRTAWSVAEFAESPLSGLLPAASDLMLVAELMEYAWDVAGGQ